MRSIRRHLSAYLLAGLGALAGASGLGCYLLVEGTLSARFDRGLIDKATALGTLVEAELFGVEFNFTAAMMPEFSRSERPEYFQLWFAGGKELARSASLGSADLPRRSGTIAEPAIWNLVLPDGRRGRAAGLRFAVAPREPAAALDPGKLAEARKRLGMDSGGEVTVVLARDTLELSQTLAALARGLLIAGAALALGTVLLVRRVVAGGCRPLDELARRIEDIDVEQLGESDLEGPPCPAELEPLRAGFQRFRRRIAASIEREKRLTSNIAHELRTPIAELRTITDLARMWPDDEELRARSLADAHAIALQMDRLLRTCLRLARLESGQAAIERPPIDLSALLGALCRQIHEFANGRDLRLEEQIPPGVSIRSDPELLELILANLLDNAFHHAPDGTWVRVALERHGEAATITLANPVEGLEEGDLAKLEEPFWHRLEPDAQGRHLGLGLPMASAAARKIDARLNFAVRAGCFEVELALQA